MEAIAQALNNPKAKGVLSRVRVVAAYPGGSADIPDSKNRLAGFTAKLRDTYHVEIVESIDALLGKVDVVFLESVDGRPHLEQVRPVFRRRSRCLSTSRSRVRWPMSSKSIGWLRNPGRPVFPARHCGSVPVFAASATMPSLAASWAATLTVLARLERHHPDLFWYGIHGVETLFTIMGPGCVSVTRSQTKDAELVTGMWKDERIGTFRGIRKGTQGYGAMVFGAKAIAPSGGFGGYEPMLVAICEFFETRKPPVSAEETLEIYAFMEAADESKRQGGKPVTLASVLERREAKTPRRNRISRKRPRPLRSELFAVRTNRRGFVDISRQAPVAIDG